MAEESVTLRELLEAADRALTATLERYMATHCAMHQQEHLQVLRDAALIDARLLEANEFRAQLSHERGLYVSRDMLDSRLAAMNTRFEQLIVATNTHFDVNGKRISVVETIMANMQGRIYTAGAILSLIVTIVASLAAALMNHIWK